MSQYTAYFVLAPLAAFLSVGVLFYAWHYRTARGMSVLIWLMFSILGWLTCNILDLSTATEAGTVFWAKAGYIFIQSTILVWLWFALHYTDRYKWLRASRFAWLCVIPLLTVVIVFTNEKHHLLWATYAFVPVGNALAIQISKYGPWFWLNVFYTYLLVFVGAALIIQQSFKSFSLYRQQALWLVIGALIPIIGNALYVFRLIPGLVQDYTSVTFAVAAIAFIIGMSRHQLFNLQPIARDAVIDSMQDAMFALDHQDRIVDLNPAALNFLGIQVADAVLGRPVTQVLAPWRNLVEQFSQADVAQSDIMIGEGSQQRYYGLYISPLYNRYGHLSGRLIILRDISERKVTELVLRERTAELEALNEQLNAFAHTVAHDIKDPLGGVVALTSLLREYYQDLSLNAIQEYLDAISQNALRLVSIVDALLLLASVRQVDSVKAEPLDMAAIIAGVQSRLAVLIAKYRATIIVPERWPVIYSYGPWIEEVWANYISNAVKYGGRLAEGIPPRVELGFSVLDPGLPVSVADGLAAEPPSQVQKTGNPKSKICFWVRDNGVAIGPAQQAVLFTKFTPLRDMELGHGLGLSIVRNIVEKLGGEVGVESDPEPGNTFWFTLPVS